MLFSLECFRWILLLHTPCQARISFVTHYPEANNIIKGQIQYFRNTPEHSLAGSVFPEIEMELREERRRALSRLLISGDRIESPFSTGPFQTLFVIC